MSNVIRINDDLSPFDQIRQTRADGSEFWSARDMMRPLGYSKWENFQASIERAASTALNSGRPESISRRQEMVAQGGASRTDYELSRFGAYLVAMNGDPRKAEVAAAQAYFAIRTREAEVAAPQLTDEQIVHRALEITTRQVEQLTERVAELEPPANAWQRFCGAAGDLSASEAAKALARAGYKIGGHFKLYDLCDRRKEDGGLAWFFRNGHGQREAYQRVVDQGLVRMKPGSYENGRTGELVATVTPRFTAKGLDAIAKHLGDAA